MVPASEKTEQTESEFSAENTTFFFKKKNILLIIYNT